MHLRKLLLSLLLAPALALGGGTSGVLLSYGGTTDPFFAEVVSLLHFEGTDGGTTFTDVISDKSWAPVGTFTTETDQFKFGATSGFDSTTTSHIITASDADFGYGASDFTIEFWAYPTVVSATGRIFYDQRDTGVSAAIVPTIYTPSADGSLRYFVNGVDRISAPAGSFVLNSWQFFAVSRVSGTTRMFVDGVQVGSSYADANTYIASRVLYGNAGDAPTLTFGYVGYFDEARITNGVGRYSANFTPPTEPFPDN